MNKTDIMRHMRRYIFDPAHRNGKQGRTIANISALSQCDRRQLRMFLFYGCDYGPAFLSRLSRAIEMIENGDVRFIRNFGHLKDARGRQMSEGPHWTIEHVTKPKVRPPPQDRITRANDHATWARCRTCQGDKWTLVEMGGKDWYACNNCVGPVHWPAIGARKINDKPHVALYESRMWENFSFLREG
jgi:hypothetical protein